jgi:uncharacterized protein with von Willebrand factor type A (vWA) domain
LFHIIVISAKLLSGIIQQLVSNRMFPLTLKGLEDAMRMLSK